ncbi:hypothetical protein SAMN05192561_12226 [Halopenitus malekzadehii]|uniref:Uncharacterized protein n=1 Tax=Halopenitus malekzadehii TaxID=1267564 RepID=A0A1H6JT59_9EURY|nr:rod-determining factor RdfA [Halopenitus malekzadehii]SEH65712.1 hypothetical protein SAMN05192561_12226 [Halopenitus malekzadehii]
MEKDSSDTDPVQSARDTVFAMENRTEKVADNHVDRLAGEAVAIDEYTVLTDVTIACDSCGQHHEFGAFLDNGGCNCCKESVLHKAG